MATDVSGFAPGWVPMLLAVFGLGSFAGVTLSGRLTDTRPLPLLVVGGSALLIGWVAVVLVAVGPAAMVALLFVQATLS